MAQRMKGFLFWTPRILTILFILFLGLFALDVFSEGHGFWGTLAALFMHLIPNMIVLVILLLAWKWEWIGAVLFAALGIFYIVWAWGLFPLMTYVVISGPLFLISILFGIGWVYREEIKGSPEAS